MVLPQQTFLINLLREKCFIRDVSHELRTPVAIIKNAVEVYREQHIEDNNNPVIDRISQASTQMEQNVTTLLKGFSYV
jgi:signal transduction histidine kinase